MPIETEVHLLLKMRETARNALPERAFLHIDRGDALLITNAPVFDPDIRAIPGFTIQRKNQLMCLSPDAGWLARFEAMHPDPPDSLCAGLARFRGCAPDEDNLRLFIQGLKLLDIPGSPAENQAYDRALRRRAAVALRGGCGGGLYAAALINACINPPKGENQP